MENKPKLSPNPKSKLMDQVVEILRYYHYAHSTKKPIVNGSCGKIVFTTKNAIPRIWEARGFGIFYLTSPLRKIRSSNITKLPKSYKSRPGSILCLKCFLLRLIVKHFHTLRYFIPVLFLANPYMCRWLKY